MIGVRVVAQGASALAGELAVSARNPKRDRPERNVRKFTEHGVILVVGIGVARAAGRSVIYGPFLTGGVRAPASFDFEGFSSLDYLRGLDLTRLRSMV